jgi:hypothetical protein
MIKNVAIFGSGIVKPGSPDYDGAFVTAKLLAENGLTIINGGGPGVMKAASLGAKAGGGKCVGVIFNSEDMTHFEAHDPTNPVDEIITTANYAARTMKMLEMGDVYVLFNGGTGTISEFGMAWGLARMYFGRHKPLILFGTFWHEVLEAIGKNMILRPEEIQVYRIVTRPEEVWREIKALSVVSCL